MSLRAKDALVGRTAVFVLMRVVGIFCCVDLAPLVCCIRSIVTVCLYFCISNIKVEGCYAIEENNPS